MSMEHEFICKIASMGAMLCFDHDTMGVIRLFKCTYQFAPVPCLDKFWPVPYFLVQYYQMGSSEVPSDIECKFEHEKCIYIQFEEKNV